jgi:hypothetical protein
MEAEGQRKPWYRKIRYIVILAVLVILLVASFAPYLYHAPVTRNQARLNMAVDYLANNYNSTMGLVREYPGSNTYWLYSDNYLASLALARYDPTNSSTTGFASALEAAISGYLATAPASLWKNQYTALNSTESSFACSMPYEIAWTQAGTVVVSPRPTAIMTTANDQGPLCASQNYADLYLLQAVLYHRLGNSSAALHFYDEASADFNGVGVKDLASNSTLYQTYKLALYVYASSCLGQTSGASFGSAEAILFSMQDNSTGGFHTGYTGPAQPGSSVNTETTALAALALELIISPKGTC